MNIIPEFNINHRYKDCKPNSILNSRNIIVNDTGEFIKAEDGLKPAITEWYNTDNTIDDDSHNIVGIVPTSDKLYIFCDNNNIYELKSKDDKAYKIKGDNNWKYIPNTSFIGTYTYMSNNKTCLAISQFVNGTTNSYYKYPLQSWIIDDNNISNYNIAPDIPSFTTDYKIDETGNLISGVYTFFIRFKISNHDYTDWFQITDDIHIISKLEHEIITHNYKIQNSIKQADTINFDKFNVNKIGHTNKNINITVNITDDDILYKDYQIGCVEKIEDKVVGRIILDTNNLESKTNTFNIYNNDFIEEVSVDDLIRNPINFFNVKSLCNYNNRLYIANYQEHDVSDMSVAGYATLKSSNKDFAKDKYDKNTDSKNYNYAIINMYFQLSSTNIKNIKKEVKIVPVTSGKYNGYYKVCDETSTDVYSEVNNFWKYIAENLYIQNGKSGAYEPISSCVVVEDGDPVLDDNGVVKEQNYIEYTYSMYIGDTFNNAIAPIHNSSFPGNECDDLITQKLGNHRLVPPKLYGRDGRDYYTVHGPDNGKTYSIEYLVSLNANKGKETINIYISTTGQITLVDSRWAMKSNIDRLSYEKIDLNLKANESESESDINNGHYKIETLFTQGYNGGWGQTRLGLVYSKRNIKLSRDNSQVNAPWKVHVNKTYYNTIYAINEKSSDISLNSSDTAHHLPVTNIYSVSKIVLKNITVNESPSIDVTTINKTLIPKQKYKTFIHFIRKDGTATLGYPIDNNFDDNIDNKIKALNIVCNTIPDSYKGYFITYEKPIKNVEHIIIVKYNNKVTGTNSNIIYNQNIIYTDSPKIAKYVYNKLGQNYVILEGVEAKDNPYIKYGIINSDNYNNIKFKTLYRLTPNIYTKDEYNDNKYLPGYYNKEKSIIFDKPVMFIATSETVCNIEDTEVNYGVSMIQDYVYSDIPIDDFVIKQDFETAAITFTKNGSSDYLGSYTNNILSPQKLKDFLTLPACYTSSPIKTFTNFVKDTYKSYFPQTIYRSNQISDENNTNAFRLFDVDSYKNIFENKGEIVNIIGVGTLLLVHTKYSLFRFDNKNNLTADIKLKKIDVFDNSYEDCFPDKYGYGGLDNIEESILCKAGYIWFDKNNKTILRYDNDIKALSDELDIFIKKLNVETIRFAYTQDKRILICIYYKDDYNTMLNLTVSYNLNTSTLISCHDYTFTKSYNTYNETYLFDNNKDKTNLYVFDKNVNTYNQLKNTDCSFIPSYNNNLSYIDIIFNANYSTIKVLESINYSLYKEAINKCIYEDSDVDSIYSGDEVIIYSDSTYSGILDIKNGTDFNNIKQSKLPYYCKGQWYLNYFRNKLSNKDDIQEINTNFIYYDKTKQKYIVGNTNDNIHRYELFNKDINNERRLIYGKYIVVRFIFNTKDFILENMSFTTNPY